MVFDSVMQNNALICISSNWLVIKDVETNLMIDYWSINHVQQSINIIVFNKEKKMPTKMTRRHSNIARL